MEKRLIIEIPYGGLGDHLFHSHLPRIAKIIEKYDKVFISNKSLFRHHENRQIVWEMNPYIDGFIDEPGKKCNLSEILLNIKTGNNLLDEIMCFYDLDDGTRMHEPEIYYNPIFIKEYNKVIFDPNFLSWVGEIDKKDMMWFIKKRNYSFDAIMKIRTEKVLYKPKPNDLFIETPNLQDFCNLIYSSKQLYCLTSGTATIAAALGKPAKVFYGKGQESGFRHSPIHEYFLVKRSPKNKLFDLIRTLWSYFKTKKSL